MLPQHTIRRPEHAWRSSKASRPHPASQEMRPSPVLCECKLRMEQRLSWNNTNKSSKTLGIALLGRLENPLAICWILFFNFRPRPPLVLPAYHARSQVLGKVQPTSLPTCLSGCLPTFCYIRTVLHHSPHLRAQAEIRSLEPMHMRALCRSCS